MKDNNPFFRFLKNLYINLNKIGLIKLCGLLAPIIFISGLIIAYIIAFIFGPEGYNMWDNYISDLGSFNYTPTPFILDSIAISTSIIFFPLFIYFSNQIYQNSKENKNLFWKIFHIIMKILAIIGFIFLILAIIGFFGIGLFSEDRTTEYGLHLTFSYIVFGGFSLSAIFNGIVILLKNTRFPRIIGLFMIFSTPTFAILFLINPETLTRPFLEWMMFLSIAIWLLPIDLIMLKLIKNQ